jgi:hypothetical protein
MVPPSSDPSIDFVTAVVTVDHAIPCRPLAMRAVAPRGYAPSPSTSWPLLHSGPVPALAPSDFPISRIAITTVPASATSTEDRSTEVPIRGTNPSRLTPRTHCPPMVDAADIKADANGIFLSDQRPRGHSYLQQNNTAGRYAAI